MNSNTRFICIIYCVIINCLLHADVTPYLAFRSQGINGPREMVGWQTAINRYDMDQNYCVLTITPEYARSFRHKDITTALFCNALTAPTANTHQCSLSSTTKCCSPQAICCCDCPVIKIQGTKVTDRDPLALMAENFYLPTDYKSEITFKPVINNFIVDLNMYIGFDEWLEGLYFRLHAPLCHSNWNMRIGEYIQKPGTQNYDVGYFNDSYIPSDYLNPEVHGIARSSLLHSFCDYIAAGKSIQAVPNNTYESLAYARINKQGLSSTRFAEITAACGYNFILCEDYYCGLNLRAAAPTGNRPKARWLFEPIVGNGHHWELGTGLDSRVCIWRSEDEDRDVTMYLDATLTHLFKTQQTRTFDLKGKPLSRYMLAMKFRPDTTNLLVGNDSSTATIPPAQYAQILTPVANLTTGQCYVSASVQGEVIAKIAYSYKNLQYDIGYNFWGRSHLKIRNLTTPQLESHAWGLKGDAFVYGFPTTYNPLIVNPQGIPLSATEQRATIFHGTNRDFDIRFIDPACDESVHWNMNAGVDNPALAFNSALEPMATHATADQDPISHEAIWYATQSSQEPIFITRNDIDISGAETSGRSHKLFMHLSYAWQDRPYCPFLGIGGEVEFGSSQDCCCRSINRTSCSTSCCTPSHKTISLSQWGIWLKAGLTFKS